jgi:putative DNA primase/helicase
LAVALWIVHAHAFEVSRISPRLAIVSPEKRCGKTTLLLVIRALVPRALSSDNITAAALFRTVEAYRPTLLIDEADVYLKDNEELRGIINSGHIKEGQVIRVVGDDHEPRAFSTFCPTVIASIGNLPDTVQDRSIVVSLKRRRANERVARLRAEGNALLGELQRKIARWVADHETELVEADPDIPEQLNDRAADNWRPLLAIADAAGGPWPALVRRVAIAMTREVPSDEESISAMLLADIRASFEGVDRMTSETLVAKLVTRTDRPWIEINRGRPISPAWLARRLKPYKVAPGTIRIGESTAKGYYRGAFEDPFSRYLPENAVTPVTPSLHTSEGRM